MSAQVPVVSRKRALALAALSLAVALATACSERPPTGAAPAGPAVADQAASQPASPGDAAHDAHAAPSTAALALPLVPATPWQSDAPLREGMRRVQRAVDALGHAEHDHLDAAQVTAAAEAVQAAVDFMFANCKLEPEPDVALHGLLAVLIKGASDLKANPADLSPLAGMREVLALYPRMFVDPQWMAAVASPSA